jgi:hypothetical protein
VAGNDEVTSPDQHKPTIGRGVARFGAVVVILALLAMIIGNHKGNIENIFLIAVASIIFLMLLWDMLMRKNGMKSD